MTGPRISEQRASMLVFVVILLIGFGLLLKMIAPYLMALAMGGIMALLAAPIQRRLIARRIRPRLAATLVTLGVILVVVGPLLTVSALAVKQAIAIGGNLVQRAEGISIHDLIVKASAWGPVDLLIDDPAELERWVREGFKALGKVATGNVVEMARSIPNVVLQTVLACMACFFLLVDGKAFFLWLGNKIPLDLEIRGRLTLSFKDTAISVVWASMAAAGTQALIMLLTFLILRVPAAALAGGATFIFAWIPLLGSGPVWAAGAVWLWMADSPVRTGFMVAAGIITGLIDNVVRPMVLKGRGEMHPLVSLVAIFGGIQMFGIFGVFFGPILAAVVITLLQVWPAVGRRAGWHFAD